MYGIKDYQSYINLLNTMKTDLEAIFKRIRLLKSKFQIKYPYEYKTGKKNKLKSYIFFIVFEANFNYLKH